MHGVKVLKFDLSCNPCRAHIKLGEGEAAQAMLLQGAC